MRVISNIHKIDSLLLSNYILKHYGPMSHLKLQKLLFYCDAYHLAYFDVELIDDKFEAWMHGPVSRKVYNSLKDKSMLYAELSYSSSIEEDVDKDFRELTQDQQTLIVSVLDDLSTWTGLELEKATHNERPWIEARIGYAEADKCHEIISKKTTQTFYKNEQNVGI